MSSKDTSATTQRERTFTVDVDDRRYELRAVYLLPDWTLIDVASRPLGDVTRAQHEADIQRLRETAQAAGEPFAAAGHPKAPAWSSEDGPIE